MPGGFSSGGVANPQTTSNQQATNQQIGVNSSGSSGNTLVIGANAVGQGGKLSISSLDPQALQVAGDAVTGAINSNSIATQATMKAFQDALTIAGQGGQSATTDTGTNNQSAGPGIGSFANQLGITPDHIIWAGIAIVAVVLFVGLRRGYRR